MTNLLWFIFGFLSCLIIMSLVLLIVYFKINAKRKLLLSQVNVLKKYFGYKGENNNGY